MNRRILAAFVTALVVVWSGAAAARDYVASGTATHFLNEVAQPALNGYGKVVQSNSAPASIMLPQSFLTGTRTGVFPIPSPSLFQFTGMGTTYIQAGTFSSGGGPGSFNWCPGKANTVNPNCLFPAQATGPVPNQRVTYTAGPNQFGGTAVAVRNIIGSFSLAGGNTYNGFATVSHMGRPYYTPVVEVGGGGGPGGTVPGGSSANNMVTFNSHTNLNAPPRFTYGAVFGPLGTIQTPGKIIGTGTANQGELQTGTGFAWTTGTISATNYDGTTHLSGSATTPIYTYWTLSGYDNRTALGAGNIQMVAGGLLHVPSTPADSIDRRTMTLTLADKVPSMGPAGMAAAAALMILAVGYAFRRKL